MVVTDFSTTGPVEKAAFGSVARANGWIIKFFPYIHESAQAPYFRNPYLSLAPDTTTGLTDDNLTTGVSDVDFIWDYFGTIYNMKFYAGFVGIKQDQETKGLRPVIGWAVADSTNQQ